MYFIDIQMSNTAQELLPHCNKTCSKNRKKQKSRTILKQWRLKEKKNDGEGGKELEFQKQLGEMFLKHQWNPAKDTYYAFWLI